MEFPHLGKHCSEKSCNKLDFLPMQCDSCDSVFCSEHFSYIKHSCPGAHKKDFQVPVCPLCGEPVPTPRGVTPDQTVGQHIDQFCKSETKKIFTNRCTYKNCKKKELIPVTCGICKQNFCLRHRHSADHECPGSFKAHRNLAAEAAEYRKNNKPTTLFTANLKPAVNKKNIVQGSREAQNIQGNMTEDEALAHALAISIMELDESADRNRRTNENSTLAFTANLKPAVNKKNIVQGSREAQNIQGNMTEDEALAHALAISIMELDESADRNRRTNENSTLAVGGSRSSKEKCSLS